MFSYWVLQDSQEKNANPVMAEEAKLKAKYPSLGQKPGGSDFLMKRLQKGVSTASCRGQTRTKPPIMVCMVCRLLS